MDEPKKKKLKIKENDLQSKLNLFQEHLLNNCLCTLPETENILQNLFWQCHPGDVSWSSLTSNWSRDEILMFITSIQLICELAIRQNAKGFLCPNVANVCNTFIYCKSDLIDYFLELADGPNQFISFATSRALSSFFLIVDTCDDQSFLDDLARNVTDEEQPFKLSFSLEVLIRLIKWRDLYKYALEDTPSEGEKPSRGCNVISVRDIDRIDFTRVKHLCIESLKEQWPPIVNKFGELIEMNSPSYQYSIITFLNLWKAIISVKTNISVNDTKPFYSNLTEYVSLLTQRTPPIIWKRILSLLNEVLCYGSTLALQGMLPEEPCMLAQTIVRKVRNQNILDVLPYREGSGRFGGGTGDGDKVLLKKLVLLVLKAVAVTVKEAKCNSSSDSSLGSETDDTDADMRVIERSIEDIIRRLDRFIKELLPFHPQSELAHWVVPVFVDQDDYMIESMICCLDVSVGLCYRDSIREDDLHRKLNPCITFLQFLQSVSFDHNVLLDYLVSNETNFLLYIYRYLKYICRNWNSFNAFKGSCGIDIEKVMGVVRNLESAIECLISHESHGETYKYLLPVRKLLRKCKDFYKEAQL